MPARVVPYFTHFTIPGGSMKAVPAAFLALSLFISATVVYAAQTGCPEHFAGGQSPDIINRKLSFKAREVCYSEFGLMHSGVPRTPLYAAEHLSLGRLALAGSMKRNSRFFPDPHIPISERAELRHYARSGYDRGHMAPSADMPDKKSQQESFSLANMVPQDPANNRGVWEGIESSVRKLARDRGELYIVTGPVFQGERLQRIGGAVLVPTLLYKAVYDPRRHEAGAYLVENAAGAQTKKISISELEKVAGISTFPSLSAGVKSRVMDLPDPGSYKERNKRGGR
jgi:endonuclease G